MGANIPPAAACRQFRFRPDPFRYAVVVSEQISYIVIGVSLVVTVLSLIVIMKKSSALSARLAALVTTFGWEGPRRVWWNRAIRARWQGLDVELRHFGRYKSMPERLL